MGRGGGEWDGDMGVTGGKMPLEETKDKDIIDEHGHQALM